MGLRFPAQVHGQCFFITTTFADWAPLGDVPGFYETLAVNLEHYRRQYRAAILGFVFMPTHIHLVIAIEGPRLSGFMRDFKKYVSQRAAKELGIKRRRVWIPRYDRVVITSEEVLRTKLEYVHNNPAKAGLVDVADKWLWSSARAYSGAGDCPIAVWTNWAS
jgi:REP element-mobilizing transposase RayT